MRYFVLIIFMIFGCASQSKVEEPVESKTSVGVQQSSRVEAQDEYEEEDLTYVVIHKTTPLYFQRDVNGDYLQFMTSDENRKFVSSVESEERKIRDAEKEKIRKEREKRIEREKAKEKNNAAGKSEKRRKKRS